jgi:hypothetical protein
MGRDSQITNQLQTNFFLKGKPSTLLLGVPNQMSIDVMLRSYVTKNLRCFASTPFRLSMTLG